MAEGKDPAGALQEAERRSGRGTHGPRGLRSLRFSGAAQGQAPARPLLLQTVPQLGQEGSRRERAAGGPASNGPSRRFEGQGKRRPLGARRLGSSAGGLPQPAPAFPRAALAAEGAGGREGRLGGRASPGSAAGREPREPPESLPKAGAERSPAGPAPARRPLAPAH